MLRQNRRGPNGNFTKTFRKPSENLPKTFRKPSENLPKTFRKPSENLPETFRKPSGNLPETFRKPEGFDASNQRESNAYKKKENKEINKEKELPPLTPPSSSIESVDGDEVEVFEFPNGTVAYHPPPKPKPETLDVAKRQASVRHMFDYGGDFFTVIRANGVVVSEDQWLYEHLSDTVDKKRMQSYTQTLSGLCYQNNSCYRQVTEWLLRPIAERMAACHLVELKPAITNGVAYGIKAMADRWEEFSKELKRAQGDVDKGDYTLDYRSD